MSDNRNKIHWISSVTSNYANKNKLKAILIVPERFKP